MPQQAAEAGDAVAQFCLGHHYYYAEGRGGLPVDPVKAATLYRQAVAGGGEEAASALLALESPAPSPT